MKLLLAILIQDPYALTADHQEQAGTAKGQVEKFNWKESKAYPGTERDFWIYLPANLDAAREYPVVIFQDGGGVVNPKGQFRATIVLDNLIHKGETPPCSASSSIPATSPPRRPPAKPAAPAATSTTPPTASMRSS